MWSTVVTGISTPRRLQQDARRARRRDVKKAARRESSNKPGNDTEAKMKDAKIVALLKQAYAAELETVQNYLANAVWLDGLGAQEVSEWLAEEVTEELGHARKLAHRLKQLGACPPGSLKLERRQKSLQPPVDSTDVLSVVQGLLDAENDAIACYQQIIKACDGRDHVTQDLAIKLQADEEAHRCLFEGFLKSLKKESAPVAQR
jgi:bacterioferritin